ncbi:hypothetical protein [Actinomadura sp. WAC 06369]|nr:hypothetical protein [Actinomadura sp. WAC 06369]
MISTDAELAAQPVGYWTGITSHKIVGYLRAELDRLGITQPE